MLPLILENNKKCSICNVFYPTTHALLRHYRIHFPDNEKSLKCDYCDLLFTKREIKKHLRNQHGLLKDGQTIEQKIRTAQSSDEMINDKDHFNCQFCEEEFTNEGSLRLHAIRSHKNQTNTTSSSNEDNSDTPSCSIQSDIHQQPESVRIFNCRCGLGFLRMFDYKQHIIQQHNSKLTFFAHECRDSEEFETFKIIYCMKHRLSYVESNDDNEQIGYFKCKESANLLSGTCSAGLNVFKKGNGYVINGVLTHCNHEMKSSVTPKLDKNETTPNRIGHKETAKASPPVSITSNIPKSGKDLLGELFNVKVSKGRKPKELIIPVKAAKPSSNNVSLDLFSLNKKKHPAPNKSADEPKPKNNKMSLDLFNLNSTGKSTKSKVSSDLINSKNLSMTLFDLGVNRKHRSSSSSSDVLSKNENTNDSPVNDTSSNLSDADQSTTETDGQISPCKFGSKPLDLIELGFQKSSKTKNGLNKAQTSNGSKLSLGLFSV